MPRAWDHGFQIWNGDPALCTGSFTPTAGQVFGSRIYVRGNQPVYLTNICYIVSAAGSGVQLPVNVFFWIVNNSGTLLTNSSTAAQDTPVQTSGYKTASMTATQLLQPNSNYWICGVIGTQSTTAVQLRSLSGTAAAVNAGVTNGTARGGTQGAGVTAAQSITPASWALAGAVWFGGT